MFLSVDSVISGSNNRRLRLNNNLSDEKLLLMIASQRCEDSFRVLFSRYANKIMTFSLKGGLSESEGKDLVQDTMSKVWLKASLYHEDKGAASTWIYTIARNVKFDLFRKKEKRNIFLSFDEIWHNEEEETFYFNEETNSIEAKVDLKIIENIINKIADKQKEVFKLVYFEGYTHQECAEKLSLPLGTVKSRLRLACRKLNQILEGDNDEASIR